MWPLCQSVPCVEKEAWSVSHTEGGVASVSFDPKSYAESVASVPVSPKICHTEEGVVSVCLSFSGLVKEVWPL